MKIVKFIILFILFVVLFIISYANTQIVNFNIPFNKIYQLPLIILLFVPFVIGAILGILAMLYRILYLRGQVANLKKELKKAQDTVLKLMSNEPTTTVVIKESVTPETNEQSS